MACERAKACLSRHGYEVEARDLMEHPPYKEEMMQLGYDTVPTVVIEGRAFPGFPDEVLLRELGVKQEPDTVAQVRGRVELTVEMFRMIAGFARQLPAETWDVRVVEHRDRPLGQWVWHIFGFADEIIEASTTRQLTSEQLLKYAERKYWTDEERFRTFAAIADYGVEVAGRLEQWAHGLTDDFLARSVETAWGAMTLGGLLSHLLRHSSIHLRQVTDRLRQLDPSSGPSDEELSRFPAYASLTAD